MAFDAISQAVAVRPSGFDAFLQMAASQPLLDAQQERAEALRVRQHDDAEAARRLVLANLRFVISVARGYLGYGLPLADLVQEGSIGLIKAVRRFDPAHGVRLISYAVHWIRAQIHDYILHNFRLVRHTTTHAQRKLFFNLRKLRHGMQTMSEQEVADMSAQLSVSPQEVRKAEAAFAAGEVALHTQDGEPAPEHWLAAADADPAQIVEQADWNQRMLPRLRRAVAQLDDRSRDIVQRRLLCEGAREELKTLGAKYAVSAERVRQIEARAVSRLREELAA
ncbi:MAG TPA: RNA polymerase factor sigma-32 [Nevskiaceae bacterium]|nr:RNA polymerase factor sigma-32 [Nevskiaceae bacterium]